MKSIYKNVIISFLMVLTIILFSCSQEKNEDTVESKQTEENNTIELTEAQLKATGIKLEKVQQRELSGVLKVSGKLDVPPQNLVSISAPFGGFLQSTEMLQGMQLHKGERIAVIQNPEYIQLQQDYLDNKSQLSFLEAEFHRQEELSKENVSAQKNLQQARALNFSKLAVVNGLHAKLKMLNVDFVSLERGDISSTINLYAPINGFVTEVNFNVGSFVNPTDILFKIVDTGHLHAELTVFEKDVVKVKKGQKIRFTLAGNGKERFATVYLIGREISADRTVRVHGHLDVEDAELLPGMYLSAVIELGNNMVYALPEKAIVNFEGNEYVFIADENGKPMSYAKRFKLIKIKTGIHKADFAEVIFPEDFDIASTPVVIEGAYSLISKMKNNEEL